MRDDTAQDKAIDYDEAKVMINAPPVARSGPDRRAAPGDAVTFDAGEALDKAARLIGSPDLDDYPLTIGRWEGRWVEAHRALISAQDAKKIAIIGPGRIDCLQLLAQLIQLAIECLFSLRKAMRRIGS